MTTPNTDLAEQLYRAICAPEWDEPTDDLNEQTIRAMHREMAMPWIESMLPVVDAAVKRGQAEAIRDAADDPSLLVEGHSGIIGRVALLLRADLIEKEAGDG